MNVDLTRLNNNIDDYVDVDFKRDFTKEELSGTDLLECSANVTGDITKNNIGDIILNLNVSGIMIIPCAITLKPTEYPYNIEITGDLAEKMEKKDNFFTNTLDIFPIIWENILLEIPMRVVSSDAKDIKLSGDGWKLITDEEVTSSPLAELEDLIKDREVR